MPVMDEFKKEREALKNAPLKQRLSYFWLYYKWYVIGGGTAVILIVSTIISIFTQKETALMGAFINVYQMDSAEEYLLEFAEYAGINTNDSAIVIDSNLYYSLQSADETSAATMQKITVYVAAREMDIMVSEPGIMMGYAYTEIFADLRDVLTAEQIEKYEPYFYYVDMKLVNDLNERYMDDNFNPSFPDPDKPEKMEQPVPIGIYVNDCHKFLEQYLFPEKTVIMGIVINSQNLENALKFLDFIMLQG